MVALGGPQVVGWGCCSADKIEEGEGKVMHGRGGVE